MEVTLCTAVSPSKCGALQSCRTAYRKDDLHAFCDIGSIGNNLGHIMSIIDRADTQSVSLRVCLDRDDLCHHKPSLRASKQALPTLGRQSLWSCIITCCRLTVSTAVARFSNLFILLDLWHKQWCAWYAGLPDCWCVALYLDTRWNIDGDFLLQYACTG